MRIKNKKNKHNKTSKARENTGDKSQLILVLYLIGFWAKHWAKRSKPKLSRITFYTQLKPVLMHRKPCLNYNIN